MSEPLTLVTRPALRWHGGKWRIAPWIIAHLPPHRTYVEPFGGAASILLRKRPAISEIYNDLDDAVVGLFRVLRDADLSARLIRALRLTPFARAEFAAAYEPAADPVEAARRTIVRSFMGFGSDGTAGIYRTGFRGMRSTCGSTPATEWHDYPAALEAIVARLAGVMVEKRPALDVMRSFDDERTLHYVDPPYLPETRSQGNRRRGAGHHVYAHELTANDHVALLAALTGLRGMVVLSGYHSALYDGLLTGWRRVERAARADANRPRTEVLWLNPAAQRALNRPDAAFAASDQPNPDTAAPVRATVGEPIRSDFYAPDTHQAPKGVTP